MMKVIQTTAEIGADRTLHVPLPADVPEGTIEVLVVLGQPQTPMDPEARRAAIRAATGSLRDVLPPTEEFLAERREDDRRRDAALGL